MAEANYAAQVLLAGSYEITLVEHTLGGYVVSL